MSKTLLQEIDRTRNLERSREVKAVEQLCRITLAADAPTHIDITWCEGLGKKAVLYVAEPGKSFVWPLNRTRSYLGPFDLFERYERSHDERELAELRDVISVETARFMNRYDYPRDDKTGKPIGEHRAPRFQVEILNQHGGAEATYFLPRVYGYHEFDDMKFEHKPSEAELREHYEQKLALKDAAVEEMRRETAELRGMILGAAATAKAPSAPGRKQRAPHPEDCQCVVHRRKHAPGQELLAAAG
jgi:hypothetical protein